MEAMKDIIRVSTPDIPIFQETKLEELAFLQASHFFWKNGNGIVVSARGGSGGLGTLWNSTNFDLTLFHKHSLDIHKSLS